jgi:Protein of unknown function (DUF3352)
MSRKGTRKDPMLRRLPAPVIALAAAALALAGAGCGGATGTGGGSDVATAAHAFPAHPLAFVDVNLDRGSAAWKQADAVGSRFPGWSRLMTQLQTKLQQTSGHGASFAKDIEPWLGGQAAVAVTGLNVFDRAHPVSVAAYVAVKDEGALKGDLPAMHETPAGSYHGFAIFKHGTQEVAAVGKGALLISNSTATLHQQIAALDGGPSLAGQQSFTQAMATLPADSLIRAYADGVKLGQVASLAALGAPAGMGGTPAQTEKLAKGLQSIGSLTAAFGADHGGLRLTFNAVPAPGHTLPKQLTGSGDAAQSLLADVPANAFAYLSGGAPSSALGATDPSLSKMLKLSTGLNWAKDVAPLLSGRVAAYAGPGAPLTAAVLLKPADPAAATAALTRITAAIAGRDPTLHFHWLPGHRGQVAAVRPGLTVGWHRTGDVIAISNSLTAGAAQSSPLSANALFQSIAHQAGLPQNVSSLGYFSVPSLLSALPAGGSQKGVVDHLGGLLMWSAVDSSGAHFTAFLSVR